MIAKMLKPLLKTSPSRLIGSSSIKNISSSSVNLQVANNTKIGDLLIIVARCRKDRSLSFPVGWIVALEVSQGGNATDIKTYIASKISGGETSVTVTQNAYAAISACLASAKGSGILATKYNDANFAYNKKSYNSDLMLAYVCSNLPTTGLPVASFIEKFKLIESSYYLTTEYFYCIFQHYNSDRTANINVQINSLAASNREVIAIEIF